MSKHQKVGGNCRSRKAVLINDENETEDLSADVGPGKTGEKSETRRNGFCVANEEKNICRLLKGGSNRNHMDIKIVNK
jgi:hypothetical protein